LAGALAIVGNSLVAIARAHPALSSALPGPRQIAAPGTDQEDGLIYALIAPSENGRDASLQTEAENAETCEPEGPQVSTP
jgi:hypothetical protein